MKVEIIAITPDPELVIETAARKCYNSFDKMHPPESTKKIIEHLIKSGHTSCIEHASVTFNIEGVSRSFTHQLVRHRICSFSQRSQRYVKEKTPEYIIPDSILENKEMLDLYNHHMEKTWELYNIFLKNGIKPEDSREILPNATHTELIATFNFRSLRNLFFLRLDSHAQKQFREVALEMLKLVYPHAPNVFDDIMAEYGCEGGIK